MHPLKQAAFAGLGLLISASSWAGALTGIVGNWHIDEEKGQTVADLSGNRVHGTLGPTAAAEPEDPAWTTRRFDTAALAFDGADDFVRVPHSNALQPKHISVEAWVKGTTVYLDFPHSIVSKSADGCHRAAYSIYTGNDGGISFYVASLDSYAESPAAAPANIWDGQWHHVVGTYDRKFVRLYVDGLQVGEGTPASFAIGYSAFTASKDLYIGDYDAAQCGSPSNFAGAIDDVRVWNRALIPAEVADRAQGY